MKYEKIRKNKNKINNNEKVKILTETAKDRLRSSIQAVTEKTNTLLVHSN